MSRATVLSTEMEAFLYSVPVAAEATMESSNSPTDATTPYADFDAQTAYELLEDDEDDDDDVSDDEGGESSAAPSASVLGSVADFLVSLSLPFLLESFFGGVYFIRTLLLGHALHFVMHFLSVTEQAVARWLGPTDTGNAISSIKGGGGGGAGSSAAWPPPTLIGLGVLTIFALIVHPDGYTWIMLRKIRDGVMHLLQSSSTCWAVAVNNYGAIISTLLALSTFAILFFFAYVLHKTLASRTPENRLRQQQNAEKHRRKKRKQHGHHARGSKSSGGRLRSPAAATTTTQQQQHRPDITLADDPDGPDMIDVPNNAELIRSENTIPQTRPPLAEHETIESPPITGSSLCGLPAAKNDRSLLLAPYSRLRASSSSTLDYSATSSVDDHSSCGTGSGRSTPTPAVVNETPDPSPVAAAFEKRAAVVPPPPGDVVASRGARAKICSNAGVQNRLPATNSRRSRRGKKATASVDTKIAAAAANTSIQTPTAPSPCKRWDALKPPNRPNSGRQRHTPSAKPRGMRDEPTLRFHADSCVSGSSQRSSTTPVSPKLGSSLQEHPLPILNSASFPVPPMGYMEGVLLPSASSSTPPSDKMGDQLDGYFNAMDQLLPSLFVGTPNRHNSAARSAEPSPILSNLNPLSPSWSDCGPGAGATTLTKHIRPPPGLENFRNDIPFGCGSSDGGNSAPASPFQSPPSMLDVYQTDNCSALLVGGSTTASSPFHPHVPTTGHSESDLSFLRNYQVLSLPPNNEAGVSLSYRPAPGRIEAPPSVRSPHRHVRENPFAVSDEEADEEQIEAELQELGGQMVGSILDF